MSVRLALIAGVVLTVLLCVPMVDDLFAISPFLDPRVRSAAPEAVNALRAQGVWVVNAELEQVNVDGAGGQVCFEWAHQYRSRMQILSQEFFTICP